MPEKDRSERVDRRIDEILAASEAPAGSEEEGVNDVLHIAATLCDLPRREFRARLKAELRERARALAGASDVGSPAPQFRAPIAAYNPRAALFGIATGGLRLANFNDGQVGVVRFSG